MEAQILLLLPSIRDPAVPPPSLEASCHTDPLLPGRERADPGSHAPKHISQFTEGAGDLCPN